MAPKYPIVPTAASVYAINASLTTDQTSDNPQAQAGDSVINQPIWVRPAEACRLASIGLTKLYELLAAGTIESRTLGRVRLIRRLDLERLGR